MFLRRLTLLSLAGLLALVLAVPATAEAQLQRMRQADERTVGIQLAKPFIEESELSFYTSTLRARALIPTGERTAFLADWGLSLAGTEFGSDWTLGNPEVGIVLVNDEGESSAYFSVVVPLAQEFGDDDVSVFTATFTDVSWVERFSEDLWSANVGLTPSVPLAESDAVRFNLEIVGSLLIPKDGGDTELFSRYVVGFSQDAATLRLRADLEGLAVISERGLSLGDRTVHQLVVGVDGLEGGPGAFLRFPLGDDLQRLDAVVGVTFTF